MATFEVTLTDRTQQRVDRVDAYRQEGPMTTFFRTGEGRRTIDSWSTRVASVRTAEVLLIRRAEPEPAAPRSVARVRCHPSGAVAG